MAGRLLVANRGEIAVRIMRTAHVLGWETIAICSAADAGAMWTRLATEVATIGGTAPADSYLSIDQVIDAARRHGATAVHPGYGMLSENAAFATAVTEAGLTFVGPSGDVIALMADKVRARAVATAANVPVLSGSLGPITDDEAEAVAGRIGWPVLIKASHGGGGRGMRVANNPDALAAMCREARREARTAFGRDELFLEAYLPGARHVEVQVIGAADGEVIVLGDRDCSLQRRRQKLVEETPAPGLQDALRRALHDAADRIARAVAYRNVGTIEFLVQPDSHRFFFLEMNTRLQVEHGITELVTGLDLVALQLRVANGEPLGLVQADVAVTGHAMEARIAAEDAAAGFIPAAGRIKRAGWPSGPGIRCDVGVAAGDAVPLFYDSMFAKILAWGPDRETARRRLVQALQEVDVTGIAHTGRFVAALVDHPAFAAVAFDIASVEDAWAADLALRSDAGATPPGSAAGGRTVWLPWGDRQIRFGIDGRGEGEDATDVSRPVAAAERDEAGPRWGDGRVVAPMDGSIVAVDVREGAVVGQGDVLIAMESMKMELAIRAPYDGRVDRLFVDTGSVIVKGALLLTIDPA